MTAFLYILRCVLFGLVLVAPIALTLSDTELTEPLEENRLKEAFPRLADCDLIRFDDCHRKIDSWFNDNYRPRDLLTKLKTQIDYSVYSTSDKVHIGADSWLFYRSTMDREKVANERMSQQEFDRLLAEFDQLDRYLRGRNIQLIVLPIPLKDVIYPEHLPRSTPDLPKNSRYQQLRAWLAGHESILTVDAFNNLTHRKTQARAFHKTDFHWNDPAGFLFAKELVDKLWRLQSGESTVLWDHPLVTREEPSSGGQANFLPLFSAPVENGLFLEGQMQKSNGTHNYSPASGPWMYTYDGSGEERGKLGPVVVVGDSFFDALHRSGFDRYFSAVYRADLKSSIWEEVFANLPEDTRYFVIELIEVKIFELSVNGLSVPAD